MNAQQIRQSATRHMDSFAEAAAIRLIARYAMLCVIPLLVYIWRDFKSRSETDLHALQQTQERSTQELRALITSRTSDRYTGTEAARDWSNQRIRDDLQDRTVDRVEDRLRTVEGRVQR